MVSPSRPILPLERRRDRLLDCRRNEEGGDDPMRPVVRRRSKMHRDDPPCHAVGLFRTSGCSLKRYQPNSAICFPRQRLVSSVVTGVRVVSDDKSHTYIEHVLDEIW